MLEIWNKRSNLRLSEEGHRQGLSNDVFYSACQQLLTFNWYNEMQRLRGVARTAGLHSGKQETRQIFFRVFPSAWILTGAFLPRYTSSPDCRPLWLNLQDTSQQSSLRVYLGGKRAFLIINSTKHERLSDSKVKTQTSKCDTKDDETIIPMCSVCLQYLTATRFFFCSSYQC